MGGRPLAERQEPVLGSLQSGADSDGDDHYPQSSAGQTEAFIETVSKPFPLDTFIDCIIPIALEHPLRGEKITAAFHQLRLVGNKHVEVIGETEKGDWEKIAVGGGYHNLQVGVQLANRHGPLSELEYSELVTGLDLLSDDLDATPDLPDMAEIMGLAKRLSQLIHEFDVQLSINVRSKNEPWMLSTLRPALQRQGLELRPDGRFIMADGDGGILFAALMNANPADDTSTLITLLLPVATVAPEREAFKSMSAFAKSLATRLSGVVVDDAGEPLAGMVDDAEPRADVRHIAIDRHAGAELADVADRAFAGRHEQRAGTVDVVPLALVAALAVEDLHAVALAVRHIDQALAVADDVVRQVELPGFRTRPAPGKQMAPIRCEFMHRSIAVAIGDIDVAFR
jgi:hypothetical protein